MAATTHTNEYEEQARVIKALNLVATLRAMKYTHGDVADCFDAGDWDTLARIADVNPPSKRTQTMVLRMMELAEAAADDPFVGL